MESFSDYRTTTEHSIETLALTHAETDTAFERLVEHELKLPGGELKPGRKNLLVFPPRDLFGLALSGGGIRSATFNLGLLQGLHELGLLGSFDYLSTVSGGGYVGGFWTAWRSRKANTGRGNFPDVVGSGAESESAEIHHLREFSNFLSPRLGVLSFDIGRLIVAILSSTLPALFAALSVLLIGTLSWLALAWLLMGDVPGVSVIGPDGWSRITFIVATAVTYTVFEVLWRKRGEKAPLIPYIFAAALAAVASHALKAIPHRHWPGRATHPATQLV